MNEKNLPQMILIFQKHKLTPKSDNCKRPLFGETT